MNSKEIRCNVLKASEMKNDNVVYFRLNSQKDLTIVNARYHKSCYKAYCGSQSEQYVQEEIPETSWETEIS